MQRTAIRLRAWLGVNGPAIDDTDDDITAAFEIAKLLDARAVRLDLDWPTLARPDSDRYRRALGIVEHARTRGLSVLACVGYRPDDVPALVPAAPGNPWQQTPALLDTPKVNELDRTFAELIRAGVRAFEGWNEWNSPAFSNPPQPFVMAVYHQALAGAVATGSWLAGRQVPVIVGGTAPATLKAHDAYHQLLNDDLLGTHYRVGDYPAHHPYAFGYDPYAAEHHDQDYNALHVQTPAIAWVWAAAHQGRAARVWATELGWPDSIGTEHDQARRATRDLTWWAEQARAGITGPVFIYTARSDRLTTVDGEAFGLRDRDNRPKQILIDAIRHAANTPLGVADL